MAWVSLGPHNLLRENFNISKYQAQCYLFNTVPAQPSFWLNQSQLLKPEYNEWKPIKQEHLLTGRSQFTAWGQQTGSSALTCWLTTPAGRWPGNQPSGVPCRGFGSACIGTKPSGPAGLLVQARADVCLPYLSVICAKCFDITLLPSSLVKEQNWCHSCLYGRECGSGRFLTTKIS